MKKTKKIVSIILLCVMVLSLMTGCNQNELGLYNLSNEISLLSTMKQEGSITFSYNFDSLLDASSDTYEQEKAMMDLFNQQVEALNLNTLHYTSSINQNKNMMQMDYYLLTDDNKKQDLFEIRLINQVVYVNYDGISELILPYLKANGEVDADIVAFFENSSGFVQFNLDELLNSNNAVNPYSATSLQLQNNYDLSKRHAFLVDLQSDLDQLMNETMKDFTTDMVEKSYSSANNADMYSYTVESDDIVDVGLSFAQYFLNNFSEFRTFFISFFENDKFLEYMGLTTDEDKAMYVQTMTTGFDMMEANLEDIKVQLDATVASEAETGQFKTMLKSFLGDSFFTYSLGKSGSKDYHNDLVLHMSFNSPYGTGENFTFDFNADSKVTASSSVSVATPQDFITFKAFNSKFPDTVTFDVDYGDYTYKTGLLGSDYGYSDVVIKDSRSYVALSSVPGKMAYAIKWSPADNKPYYVLPDGSDTAFVEDFFVENGETYIAFGEYRNTGYTVEWNDIYREITVKTQ